MKKIGKELIPISLGILLTTFDFAYDSFGRFDLSSDFVGYGLIAMGLGCWHWFRQMGVEISLHQWIRRHSAWLIIETKKVQLLGCPALQPGQL